MTNETPINRLDFGIAGQYTFLLNNGRPIWQHFFYIQNLFSKHLINSVQNVRICIFLWTTSNDIIMWKLIINTTFLHCKILTSYLLQLRLVCYHYRKFIFKAVTQQTVITHKFRCIIQTTACLNWQTISSSANKLLFVLL